MRYLMRFGWVGLGLLALAFSLTLLVVERTHSRLWLAGAGAHTVTSRREWSSLAQGMLSWDRVYTSEMDHMDVWHHAAGLANMELQEGAASANQCLWLAQTDRFLLLGTTTTVKLCPSSDGTLMYVHQTFYVRR